MRRVSFSGCGLATGVTAVFYYLLHKTDVDMSAYLWVPYACICLFGLTHSIGIGGIPHTLLAELFPQNVKCYAAALSSITFAVSSFAINKVKMCCRLSTQSTPVKACTQTQLVFAFFPLPEPAYRQGGTTLYCSSTLKSQKI